MADVRTIGLTELELDVENPRYPSRASQRDAFERLLAHQGAKILRLAEDIVEKGLNPSKRLLVTENSSNSYAVLEGNRRIAALKLLASKELRTSLNMPPSLLRKLGLLAERAGGTLPTAVDCVVTTRADARDWILLEHTGENDGAGIVGWDGAAAQRFRGGSPALQAVDLVAPHLDGKTREQLHRISITNVERLLATPEARAILGVEIVDGALKLSAPQDAALARLRKVVSDIANREIKVTGLDTKDQRIKYAREVAATRLPPISSTVVRDPGGTGTPASGTAGEPRRVSLERATVIPRSFKLAISVPRLNRIYGELQKLSLKKFLNSGAVLLRVFVELSAEEYARKHRVPLVILPKPGKKASGVREMTLKKKLLAVADHLEANGCTKRELKGIRTLAHNKDHPLSVDTLHAYVHNQDYTPSLTDLTRTWDNIQAFVGRLWKS